MSAGSKISLVKRIKYGLIFSLVLLAGAGSLSYISIYRLINHSKAVNHTNVVISKLEEMLSDLKDTETGQRGYQITVDEEFLEPYSGSYDDVMTLYRQIRILTSDIESQQQRLDTLEPLIKKKFKLVDSIVSLISQGQYEAAKSITASKDPKMLMERIRVIVHDMIRQEKILLKQRTAKAEQAINFSFFIITVAFLLAIAIAVGLMISLLRHISRRERAEQELVLTNRMLEDTIAELEVSESQLTEVNQDLEAKVEERAKALAYQHKITRTITDNATSGLLMMDDKGYCTFINPAGEKMLGYTFEEIGEKPLHYMIHHHRPDGSFYPLEECPIDRALPENFDIRAHEDVFIKKDGTFFPVSCAAGPIFENGVPVATVIEVRDITEEKKAEQEILKKNRDLLHANQELVKINTDLDNFIYTASHDLKAPVSNIEGLLYALRSSVNDSAKDEQDQLFTFIENSISRFKTTIQELAEISKVQKATDEDKEDIEVEEVFENVKLSISDLIQASNAEIHIRLQNCQRIRFSKSGLHSIVFNLLTNAIKYKSPDRHPVILAHCYSDAHYYIIEIADNGLGIPKAQQQRAFEMFKRLHQHVEGSGIGLYIVKRTLENNGGSIEVESEEGKGSKFKLYFKR